MKVSMADKSFVPVIYAENSVRERAWWRGRVFYEFIGADMNFWRYIKA